VATKVANVQPNLANALAHWERHNSEISRWGLDVLREDIKSATEESYDDDSKSVFLPVYFQKLHEGLYGSKITESLREVTKPSSSARKLGMMNFHGQSWDIMVINKTSCVWNPGLCFHLAELPAL
jgi:hypothetical protein